MNFPVRFYARLVTWPCTPSSVDTMRSAARSAEARRREAVDTLTVRSLKLGSAADYCAWTARNLTVRARDAWGFVFA